MRKIKWLNVIKALWFIVCISIVIYMVYMLTLYSYINKQYLGLRF